MFFNFSEQLSSEDPNGKPLIYIENRKEDVDALNLNDTATERKRQQSILFIEHLKKADDGLYECQGVNTLGNYSMSIFAKEWFSEDKSINISCAGE